MKTISVEYKKIMILLVYMLSLMHVCAQNVIINGIKYFLNADSHMAVVVKCDDWSGELEIPSEVICDNQSFVVKGIVWCGFYNCKELTKVRIPKTVEGILNYIPHNPEDEAGNAVSPDYMNPFVGCPALEFIEVDDENKNFKSVDGVLFSKDGTELYCCPAGYSVESYTVPQGVIWVGSAAFASSENLISVELPETITRICGDAFNGCKKLEQINLPENLSRIEEWVFRDCCSLKSIIIPISVKNICERAFAGCISLRTIDIPESVQTIGSYAFYGCILDALIIRGKLDEQSVSNYLFLGLDKSSKVYVQASETERYNKVYAGAVLPLEEYKGYTSVNSFIQSRLLVPYTIIDLQGRMLLQAPPKGVYIQNGKKVAVK